MPTYKKNEGPSSQCVSVGPLRHRVVDNNVTRMTRVQDAW